MFAFLINALIIMAVMGAFFRFMYPKPKVSFLPKAGEDSRPRVCDYCGHSLASHRGIYEVDGVETLPPAPTDDLKGEPVSKMAGERFFCNKEHKMAFYCTKK